MNQPSPNKRGRPPGPTPETIRMQATVITLRREGNSWTQIGNAIGVDRQHARVLYPDNYSKRYGGKKDGSALGHYQKDMSKQRKTVSVTALPPGELMDEAQAAHYLHQKPRTLRLWRRQRALPYLAPTAKVRLYRKSDLDVWLDRSRTVIAAR